MTFKSKTNFKLNTFIAVSSFLFFSCAEKPEAGTIKGNIKNYAGNYLYFDEITSAAATPIDSVKLLENGDFEFKFKAPQQSFFRIRTNDKNFVMLLLEDKDKVTFEADANNFRLSLKVKGSESSAKLLEATSYLQKNAIALDSLNSTFQAHQNDPNIDSLKAVLQGAYSVMMESETVYLKKFIDENSQSLATLAIIDKLPPEENMEYYKKVDAGLTKSFPNSGYTKAFHERIGEMNKLALGSEAPDIVLNSPDGKEIKLSSLKGKIVLVDFWASWCRPCRAENPNVVRIYNAYHDKGFDIYSVSLDKDKNAWIKAIADDQLAWTHVSDLGQWQSSVVKQYNISGIPFTCLLDKNGRIVAKGLRGLELEMKIKELLAIK